MNAENDYLRAELNESPSDLLGQSPALKTILSQIELVGPTQATALILGESGTRKELIARASTIAVTVPAESWSKLIVHQSRMTSSRASSSGT